jgi:hypothetical protein
VYRTHGEIVGDGCPWGNRALAGAHGAIHCSCSILEEAVEVQARTDVTKLIVQIHNHLVAKKRLNGGEWPLMIDSLDGTCEQPIWVGQDPGDVEVVGHRCGVAQA